MRHALRGEGRSTTGHHIIKHGGSLREQMQLAWSESSHHAHTSSSSLAITAPFSLASRSTASTTRDNTHPHSPSLWFCHIKSTRLRGRGPSRLHSNLFRVRAVGLSPEGGNSVSEGDRGGRAVRTRGAEREGSRNSIIGAFDNTFFTAYWTSCLGPNRQRREQSHLFGWSSFQRSGRFSGRRSLRGNAVKQIDGCAGCEIA